MACGPLPLCNTSYRKPEGRVLWVTALSAFWSFFTSFVLGAAFGATFGLALGVTLGESFGGELLLAGEGLALGAAELITAAKGSSITRPLSSRSPPSQLKVVSSDRLVNLTGQNGWVEDTNPRARRWPSTVTYNRLLAVLLAESSDNEQLRSSRPQKKIEKVLWISKAPRSTLFHSSSIGRLSWYKDLKMQHEVWFTARVWNGMEQISIDFVITSVSSSGSGGSCNNTSKKKNSRNFKNKFPDRHEQQQSTSINMQT